MDFKEVQETYFQYEEKRHKILQSTQKYFLEKKFQPYVWFDGNHKLRIKHKYIRGLEIDNTTLREQRNDFLKSADEFAEKNKLLIRFIYDFCETDKTLPEDVQSQWSTELILEVKK